LSVDPVGGYRALYASLGLQFTSAAQKIIIRSSSSQNPPEISTRSVHATKIDSRSSLSNWKRRLTSDEIARIRLLTGDAARLFYQEKDWE
jgi:hypothetical protein